MLAAEDAYRPPPPPAPLVISAAPVQPPPPVVTVPVPVITAAGLNPNYSPWAIWVQAHNLGTSMKAWVFDIGVRWGGDLEVVMAADKSGLTFTLPSNQAPSGCNSYGNTCAINVVIVDKTTNAMSDSFPVTLPGLIGPPSASLEAPVMNAGGVVQSYHPWAVWMSGRNVSALTKVQLSVNGVRWGDDLDFVCGSPTGGSFSLPSNQAPNGCNFKQSCNVSVVLTDGRSGKTGPAFSLPVPPMDN
jgi:hypothetical protein